MSCFVWQKNIYFYKKGFEKLNQQYDLFVEKKKSTSPLLYILLSSVLTLSCMFPFKNQLVLFFLIFYGYIFAMCALHLIVLKFSLSFSLLATSALKTDI